MPDMVSPERTTWTRGAVVGFFGGAVPGFAVVADVPGAGWAAAGVGTSSF
jgi:hypothetical protein